MTRDVKLTRRQARAARRRKALPSPEPGIGSEPCTCGGRFMLRDTGIDYEFRHTTPTCKQFAAVTDAATLQAYVYIMRGALFVRELHTVPWFPEMQAEVPGYIVHSLLVLVHVAQAIGLAMAPEYVHGLVDALGVDEETAADIVVLGMHLGIIGGTEVPVATAVQSGPIGGGTLN